MATSLPAGPSQGVPWRDLTVGGYAARQWSGATWNWVKILRGRSVVTVELHASRTSAATLETWARRIAGGLRYDRHELVPAVFCLGQLSGGLHPAAVSASMAAASIDGHKATLPTTSYTLSRTGALDNVVVMLIPHQGDLAHARINRPGRPVQGLATYTARAGDRPTLRISGAVGGQDVSIFAEFPGVRGATLAELYTIADHLVLHS